jgi:SOS-response transcriptional repressor LexA
MLASMAANTTTRPFVGAISPGAAIAGRRRALGLTIEDIVNVTRGVVNQKIVSRLENDHIGIQSLKVTKLTALLSALRWTVADLEEATGVKLNEGLPGAEAYTPTLRLPVLGTVAAGLRDVEHSMDNPTDYLSVDPHASGLRGRPAKNLVVVIVDGESMLSDRVSRSIPHGASVIIELGAVPVNGDIVAAWIPDHGTAVLKRYDEEDAVLRSNNPRGPVFRLIDMDVEIRGVVRLVQYRPN